MSHTLGILVVLTAGLTAGCSSASSDDRDIDVSDTHSTRETTGRDDAVPDDSEGTTTADLLTDFTTQPDGEILPKDGADVTSTDAGDGSGEGGHDSQADSIEHNDIFELAGETDIACCEQGSVKDCGIDTGECETGKMACGEGCLWGACMGSIDPVPETCNGLDDDCDDVVDNGLGIPDTEPDDGCGQLYPESVGESGYQDLSGSLYVEGQHDTDWLAFEASEPLAVPPECLDSTAPECLTVAGWVTTEPVVPLELCILTAACDQTDELVCTQEETSLATPLVSSRYFDPETDKNLVVFYRVTNPSTESTVCVPYGVSIQVSRTCPKMQEYPSTDTPKATVDDGTVESTVNVSESPLPAAARVKVKLEHTYVGALVLRLKHLDEVLVLWEDPFNTGTSLEMPFNVSSLVKESVAGDWTLQVQDTDAYDDVGKVVSWSLELSYCP